jgi:Fe-S-cluster-containing hydrogenase component 2
MCEMACSLEKEGECNRTYSRIKVAKFNEGLDVPTVCLQCEEPICEDKCPVKAIARDANGALVIDHEKCIGCKTCIAMCPFGAVWFNPRAKKVIKCDLCNGDPACVKFCQPKAIELVSKDRAEAIEKKIRAKRILQSLEKRSIPKAKRSII